MPTALAFEKNFGPEDRGDIGTVDVSDFAQIRVYAFERDAHVGGIGNRLVLMLSEAPGNYLGELDVFDLEPGSAVTRVYDVPGTILTVQTAGGSGMVYIWGRT
jgi:hypothetical protein